MENKPFYTYYKDEKEDKQSRKVFIILVVIFFVLFALLSLLGYVFYQNFSYVTISGKSMQKTLNPSPVLVKTENGSDYLQDGVYIKHTTKIDYEDIVVIDTNAADEKTIIKRVIGLEGDYVSIIKIDDSFHCVRVNDGESQAKVLQEEYIYSYQIWSCAQGSPYEKTLNNITYQAEFYDNFTKWGYEQKSFAISEFSGAKAVFFKVPEKSFFFLGDNRTQSNDSRSIGFVETSKIEGVVVDIVKNGSEYPGNAWWWFNRLLGFFRVIWQEILYFFGANA